jgi:hypothetical protein
MSILPAFKAVLEDGLSDKDYNKITNDLRALPGVLSVAFQRASQKNPRNEVWVTYVGNPHAQRQAEAVPGVKTTSPLM